jgi:hypothetical protein
MHRARERLARLAGKHGVRLRQSYARVGKHALIAYERYAHAKQFKRANRALRRMRTYLGRVFRDIVRNTAWGALCDVAGDFVEMELHRLGVGTGPNACSGPRRRWQHSVSLRNH